MKSLNPEEAGIFHPFRIDVNGEPCNEDDWAAKYRTIFGYPSEKMYAASAWGCMARILLLAFERREQRAWRIDNDQWRSESIVLHDLLSHIDGNQNEESVEYEPQQIRLARCDACSFINAIQVLVGFHMVDDLRPVLDASTGNNKADVMTRLNIDFPSMFAAPFDPTNQMAAVLLRPVDLVIVKEGLHEAHDRIAWLKAAKEGVEKVSNKHEPSAPEVIDPTTDYSYGLWSIAMSKKEAAQKCGWRSPKTLNSRIEQYPLDMISDGRQLFRFNCKNAAFGSLEVDDRFNSTLKELGKHK